MNTKQNKVPCPFCDSTAHIWYKCNFTFNGKLNIMRQIMNSLTPPHFDRFSTKELKYIASQEIYENLLVKRSDFKKYRMEEQVCCVETVADVTHRTESVNMYSDNYTKRQVRFPLRANKYFHYNPINWRELNRKNILRALQQRWSQLLPLLKLKHTLPSDEIEDCPICYESLGELTFNEYRNHWQSINKYVKTDCKHTFCLSCWNNLPNKRDRRQHRPFKDCPMCRQSVYDTSVDHYSLCQTVYR